MKLGVTQSLLALVALLLLAHLLAATPAVPSAVAQTAAPVHEVLRARRIDLVAAGGQVVAQLYTAEDGAGNLRLRNGSGEVRVKLGATADGAGLILMNQSTEPAAWLSVASAQTSLKLSERGKATRVIAP
ncbi:MAG: hypothetical protein OEW27_08280 [Aquincola sp.]|nr:hypothetical protein [Aquincola sp.]MDH5329934.1 hypothetical protein [Aquincola sp.]